MGTVWAATDEVLHRQVAIKEIDFPVGTPAAERAQLEHRTLREARAIAALSNPYVITLFDILTLDNGPVIVMELLHARSLAEILRKVGRLSDGQAATVGVAVASGLLAAHAAGITHRDVKPGNVLICDDGRIKLTDFGIARSSGDQTMTATGLLLGSPAYIAPEVASGIPAGPVSDAWSLGGLLFASVEGRPPFDQGTAIATLTSVVKDPVPPHPHSGRLGAVVSGLLVKTPRLRMRVDRALTIMRGIADDPSGTNLAVVAKIPREGRPLPRTPGASTGGVVRGRHAAADQRGPGRPPAAQDSHSPLHATPRPPATSPADASTHPPGTPAIGPFGPGQGPPPGQPAAGPTTDALPTNASSTGTSSQPPAARSAPAQPPPPWTGGAPGFTQQGPRPGHLPDSQSSLRPGLPHPTGSSPYPPPANAGIGGQAEALPPPPWAQSESATLAPLPETAAQTPDRRRIVAALLVALVAAIVGFFGVRIIADLATEGAASAPAGVLVAPQPAPVQSGLPAS